MKWFWQRDKKPKPQPTIPDGAIRRRLRYGGKVQSVGFRFTSQGWAEQRGLTGWVMNCSDGTVELEVQGTPEQIEAFKDDVATESAREKAFIHARLLEEEALAPIPEAKFTRRNLY